MGDKELPSRGPVGRMGDPWDEERMKLTLQRILELMEVHPIRRVGPPEISGTFNSAQRTAFWLIEVLVGIGAPSGFFGNSVGNWWDDETRTLVWADTGD